MKTTTVITQSQETKIRTTYDNYISIYDTINSYNLLEEAALIWKEIKQQDPSIKSKAISKQFCNLLVGGKKITYATPCIPVQDVQYLIAAIIEWRRLYDLSGRADYKIDYSKISKVLFNKADLLKSEENVTNALTNLNSSDGSKVVEFKARQNAVIQTSTSKPVLQQANTNKPAKKEVVIQGQVFRSSSELERKLKDILNRTPKNTYLEGEDLEFMLDLLPRCSYAQPLLKKGLQGIIVQQKPGNSYKNFALHVPQKIQTIRMQNYINPAVQPLFKLKILSNEQ